MFCPLPFLGVVGKGLWRSGSGVQTLRCCEQPAQGPLELAPVALLLCSPLRGQHVRPVSWVCRLPCWCPLPGSSWAPLEAAACWDWAHSSSPPPQVLLLSSGLLSAQVTSPPSIAGEPAHGRVPPFCWEAEVLLTRVPHMWALHSVPELGFRIPHSGHSVSRGEDGQLPLSLDTQSYPQLSGCGVKGGGRPGANMPKPTSPRCPGCPVPAPGATNSPVE